VHVEINMGGNRCGVEPGEPALALARRIGDMPHLTFAGLQAYHGSAQHLRTYDERQKAIQGAVEKGRGDARPARRQRHPCDNITGAGTGTFEFEAASGVYTELQCGSYIFMDADYGRNLDRDGAPIRAFEPSLFVWATVMSRPTEERAIVDAGLKALAFDSGPPNVWDEPAGRVRARLGRARPLAIKSATNRLKLGDKVKLVPGHCDPTVNLYDWYVGIRGDRVAEVWPITRAARCIRSGGNRAELEDGSPLTGSLHPHADAIRQGPIRAARRGRAARNAEAAVGGRRGSRRHRLPSAGFRSA
jgi:D-serine deaminase-like pyridoxal phosphate-dependent protein